MGNIPHGWAESRQLSPERGDLVYLFTLKVVMKIPQTPAKTGSAYSVSLPKKRDIAELSPSHFPDTGEGEQNDADLTFQPCLQAFARAPCS